MPTVYESSYTGAHNDEYEDRVSELEEEIETLTGQITTLSTQLSTLSTQLTTLSNQVASYRTLCNLYMIVKMTQSGTTITITVPGHANTAYDRIMIWAYGNMNGSSYWGNVLTASSSDGTNSTATFTGSHTLACTYANSGSDRVITITGLPSWGEMTFLSRTQIV